VKDAIGVVGWSMLGWRAAPASLPGPSGGVSFAVRTWDVAHTPVALTLTPTVRLVQPRSRLDEQ
jgi:hypothetical protein